MYSLYRFLAVSAIVSLAGCGFFDGLGKGGAPDRAPSVLLNAKKIDDAVPRVEPRSRGGNRSPYQVLGKWYKVVDDTQGYRERGYASWYGVKFHGNKTSNGETYNMYQMTAAHKHLPLPSYVRVKNLENGKEVIVRVNDRGPFHQGRIIDLSYAAATRLDILKKGTAKVEIEVIDPAAWLAEQKAGRASRQVAGKEASLQVAQDTAPRTSTVPKPTAAGDASEIDPLYLQVAAYQSLETAQMLQQRLLAKLGRMGQVHADTNVVIHPSPSGQLYRVRIGPLAGHQQLAQLRQHDQLSAYGKMYPVSGAQ